MSVSNQEIVTAIAQRLKELSQTPTVFGSGRTDYDPPDPKYQAAWELVTEPWRPVPHGEVQRRPKMVEFWGSNGAVRGLLEEMVETAGLGELQYFIGQPRRFNRPIPGGGRRTTFYRDAITLGQDILEALK